MRLSHATQGISDRSIDRGSLGEVRRVISYALWTVDIIAAVVWLDAKDAGYQISWARRL